MKDQHTCVYSSSNERMAESIINLGESIKYDGSNVISYLTGSDDRLHENALHVDSLEIKNFNEDRITWMSTQTMMHTKISNHLKASSE